jgi:pimeloyl-ACP methyl ester carboxylesterase
VATLYQERIARGTPARWLLLTHGIYGAGSNWRGIARKLVERRPEWGVVLVDLRQHGRSEAGDPPHTLQAAAEDLRPLLPDVAAIAGHSFGGKVVLAARAFAPPTLLQTWMFDSSPSARQPEDSSVLRVLELMERLPRTWVKRDDFVATVTAEGHALALAQWLAMNIVPDAHGTLTLRLDLAAIRALLDSYFETDLWDVAFDPALPGTVEVVIARRSNTLSAADRARLQTAPPHVHANIVDADHWLHIEAPGAVVDLLANHLP